MIDQDDMTEMYSDDDAEPITAPIDANRLTFSQKGMITEVEIDGKKLSIVDPAVIHGIDRFVRSLHTKIAAMEQDIRTLRSRLAITETNLMAARIELDNKVSYSRE